MRMYRVAKLDCCRLLQICRCVSGCWLLSSVLCYRDGTGSVAARQPGNSGLARKKRAYELETAAYRIPGAWYVVVAAKIGKAGTKCG